MIEQLFRALRPFIDRYPKLAMTYRNIRDNQYIYENPVQTTLGFKFSGNKSMQEGIFEPDETALVKRLLPHVDNLINIGANVGYYCCIALSQKKYVVAFEPIYLNLRHLLLNVSANHWQSQIEIYPIALGNTKSGIVEIYGGGTGASLVKGWSGIPDQYVTLVPCSTLDNVLGSRFSGSRCMILVDIEGAERLMLDGGLQFASMTPKPIWIIEISIGEHQPQGVSINPDLLSTFDFFWSRGYEARTADKRCRVVRRQEIEEIEKTGVDTLQTHNFLFVDETNAIDLLAN